MAEWLEWQSFGLIAISVLLYIRRPAWGASVGIMGSTSFFFYGLVAGIPAAMITQVVFLPLHAWNLRLACRRVCSTPGASHDAVLHPVAPQGSLKGDIDAYYPEDQYDG